MSILTEELRKAKGKFIYFNYVEGESVANYLVDFDGEFVKSYTYSTWVDLDGEESIIRTMDLTRVSTINTISILDYSIPANGHMARYAEQNKVAQENNEVSQGNTLEQSLSFYYYYCV